MLEHGTEPPDPLTLTTVGAHTGRFDQGCTVTCQTGIVEEFSNEFLGRHTLR